jgi:hypothetical protein
LLVVLVVVLVWDATSTTALRRGSADQLINILIEIDGPL